MGNAAEDARTWIAPRWDGSPSLRTRAEEIASSQSKLHPENTDELPLSAARDLIRELRVHQIELQLQNEHLRRVGRAEARAGERYAQIFDEAPIGYLCLDESDAIVEANAAVSAVLGLQASRLPNTHITRLVAPSDQCRWLECRHRLRRDRAPQRCELRLLDVKGEPVWVRLDVAEQVGESEIRVRVGVTDIREHRREQARLHQSEARFRALFEGSADALLVLQPPDWRVTLANPAALRLFGAPDVAALSSLALWDHDADAPPRSPPRSPTMETAEAACRYAWALRRLDGSRFRAGLIASPLEIDGGPALLVGVRDETDLEAARASRARQDRVDNMGMLAASVAHQIGNPLTYLTMLAEQLSEGLPSVEVSARAAVGELVGALGETGARQRLSAAFDQLSHERFSELGGQAEGCLDAALRIGRVILALGAFARTDGPREPVDLARAVSSAVAMSSGELQLRARLSQDLGATSCVLGSEGLLAQLFLNLLVNAAQSFPSGDVEAHHVSVRTWMHGGRVQAEVRDDGCGIAPEHLSRAFEPFFSTRPPGAGTGLGLPLCRDIVEEHGGSISLESERGRGTRVRLSFPAHERIPPMSSQAPSGNRASSRGRILVVDDEPVILAGVRRLLEAHQDVVTAAGAIEAMGILERDASFDAILCDLLMPIVGGTALHAWVKARRPDLARRMLFMTGGLFVGDAGGYIRQNALTVLQRPLDRATLTDCISCIVRTSRPETPA